VSRGTVMRKEDVTHASDRREEFDRKGIPFRVYRARVGAIMSGEPAESGRAELSQRHRLAT
jgi:hypothetical protein